MEQQNKNKAFISDYFKALTGVTKTRDLMEKFITDERLITHINFFEAAFPNYEILADEMTAEENRVVVQARFKGTHLGELNGIAPTNKVAEIMFVIKYVIENNKIVNHWMLADQMALMQQLGVIPLS